MTYIETKKYDIYFDVQDIRIESSLFEVDELIAPIISLLNKKGYYTVFCCSGHFNNTDLGGVRLPNNNCYITFSNKEKIKNINMPIDFIYEDDVYFPQRCIISKKYKSNSMEWDRYMEIYDTMKDLYEWAVKLP